MAEFLLFLTVASNQKPILHFQFKNSNRTVSQRYWDLCY